VGVLRFVKPLPEGTANSTTRPQISENISLWGALGMTVLRGPLFAEGIFQYLVTCVILFIDSSHSIYRLESLYLLTQVISFIDASHLVN